MDFDGEIRTSGDPENEGVPCDVRSSHARIQRVRGRSRLVSCRGEQPLKLLSPAVSSRVVCLVQASYGGGMVQGDRIRLNLDVGEGAAVFLTTQANSRAYRADAGRSASQHLEADLASDSLAVSMPEPMVLHAGSRLEQRQHWRLAASSTLILLDWFQCGRSDSGEIFAYRAFDTEVRIDRDGVPLIVDPFHSDPRDQDPLNPARFGGMRMLLNLYLVGRRAEPVVQALSPLACRPESRLPRTQDDRPSSAAPPFLFSVSRVEEDVVVMRAAATTRELLRPVVELLSAACAGSSLLGFDALSRKP